MTRETPRGAEHDLPIIHRNPEWRMVWDELDKPLQKQIGRAIRRGEAMDDPGKAAVAAGAAMRTQRTLTIQAALFFILGAGMALALWNIRPQDPNFLYWLQWLIAGTWLLVGVPMTLFWRHRASAAEDANRRVVGLAGQPDATSEQEHAH